MRNPISEEALNPGEMYIGRLMRWHLADGTHRDLQVLSKPYEVKVLVDGEPQHTDVMMVAMIRTNRQLTVPLSELGLTPMPNGQWQSGTYVSRI